MRELAWLRLQIPPVKFVLIFANKVIIDNFLYKIGALYTTEVQFYKVGTTIGKALAVGNYFSCCL